MRRLILFIAAMLFLNTVTAQSWQWGVRGGGGSNGSGGNRAETVVDMVTDKGGNIYILAAVNSSAPVTISGQPNALTLKGDILVTSYDCSGGFRWKKVIGGSNGAGEGYAIGVDTLGHVNIIGAITPYITPPNLPPFSDTDTALPTSNQKFFFLVQYDTAGNFKWLRQPTPDTMALARQIRSMPRDMIVNPNGDIEILCHLSPGLLSGSNIVVDTPSAYILKYDINGNITGLIKPDLNWRQVAGDGKNQTSLVNIRIVKSKSGSYVVSGRQDYNPFSPGDPLVAGGQQITKNMFVIYFSQNWEHVWTRTNDTSRGAILSHRPILKNNLIAVGGSATINGDSFNGYMFNNSLGTGYTPFIAVLDTFGNTVWIKNAHSNAATAGKAVEISDERVFLAGNFPGKLVWDNYTVENLTNVGNDIFLTRFNLSGVVQSLDSLKSSPGNHGYATALISDNRGNIYLGGEMGSNFTIGSSTQQSAGGNSDFFIAKYGNADCGNTPVPVRLTSFTATLQNQQVLTRWRTAQEQNTKAFIIERSTNATMFTPIGTVAAKGNSNVLQFYSFIDSSIQHSTFNIQNNLFYRLKILDLDGSYTYSSIAKINLTAAKGISIYPNPARSAAVVSYQLSSGNRTEMEVYNQIGQRMNVGGDANIGGGSGSRTINISGWPAGIYNVVLRSNGKAVGNEKLVVER